ncbi:MAG: hypothetical protein FPO08_10400 [Geobacter sp.]|nr:MAG: hypothetical protein FPO08_10400 [Geobacter sp.]
MADPNDRKTNTTHLAPIYCHQTKPEEAEPIRCRECNRFLKTEASIAAGIGPTCAKKVGMLDLEFTLPRKKKRIPIDPNQLGLFVAMQTSPSDLLQEGTRGAIEPTSEPVEEQPLDGTSSMLGCTITIEVAITSPGGQPSLHVAIAQGGAPCKGC